MPAFIVFLIWIVLIVVGAYAAIALVKRAAAEPFSLVSVATLAIFVVASILIVWLLLQWIPPFPGRP